MTCFTLSCGVGCNRDGSDLQVGSALREDLKQGELGDDAEGQRTRVLSEAETLWKQGDSMAASKLLNQQLIRTPHDPETVLLTGKVTESNGGLAEAIDLVQGIPVESQHGVEATALLVEWYLRSAEPEKAVGRLRKNLAQASLRPESAVLWRRQLWTLLNRLGRRQQASVVADELCRSGFFHRDVLVSLLRRGEAFPLNLNGDSPRQHFYPGMGMARWFFSQGEFDQAWEELSKAPLLGPSGAATDALRGRLLAERQAVDEFARWYRECDPESRQCSDYWIALGTYFFDQHQLSASARALLEGIYLDPTDDDACHRMARVLAALRQEEQAALMREHAIRVATLKNLVKQLSLKDAQPELTENLPAQLLSIARPFEAIGWSLIDLPPGNELKRAALMQQLAALRENPELDDMNSEFAMMEMDRSSFEWKEELKSLSKGKGKALGNPSSGRGASDVAVPSPGDPEFMNVARTVGLDFQWYPSDPVNLKSIPLHEILGGGIAVCDFDLDGYPDVYLGQGSGEPPTGTCTRSNQMFRNLGQRFAEVTDSSGTRDFGYAAGIAAGDVNQDGFPDLYLGCLGENRLLINNGDGTYRDASEVLGDASPQFTSSVAIADLTGDGNPELYECVYVEMQDGFRLPDRGDGGQELPPNPNDFYAECDRWFLNQGDGQMVVQILDRKNIEPGTALGVIVTDIDGDGSNDVFVANDARPNHLLMRFAEGKVVNVADLVGLGYGFRGFSNSCMGIASGDFNRDGRLDFHITNFIHESNNFFLQGASGIFSDYASRYRLNPLCEPFTGFGIKKIDLRRDGWSDFVVTNGHVFDQRAEGIDFQMYPQILINNGESLNASGISDSDNYFKQRHVGRSMALIDFDRDQDLDLLVGHLDSPLALLENRTEPTGEGVQLELIGTVSERDATGCRVVVQAGGLSFTDWVTAGDGYLCNDELVLDFGLGAVSSIESIEVHWTSGTTQVFSGLKPGRRYVIIEGAKDLWQRQQPAANAIVD